MKILVTGSKGFIGKNLICELKNRGYKNILEYDIDTEQELLERYTLECDFIFHLAGVNRPQKEEDFMKGNFGFTLKLLEMLKTHKNKCPILITSSIQAALDNSYGRSKKASEELIISYRKEYGINVYIYRLPNVFGKWCRPNYNSVIATFCYNIAHNLPIKINDPQVLIQLVYIDDVVKEFISALEGRPHQEDGYCFIPNIFKVKLGDIANLLYKFKESRNNLQVPNMSDEFEKALYSTYLSYLPKEQFSYPLKMNIDNRGSFTEILRTRDRGQFSVNIIKSGITKGNHWHHSKNEKFVVVKGKALIQLRKIGEDDKIEYYVNGDKIEVIDIPPGYTHNIKNIGVEDLVVFMWASEPYNPEKPDTYFEAV